MGKKISELPQVTTPATTDEFVVNQAGASKKITLQQVQQANISSNPVFAGLTLSSLTAGYLPFIANDKALANSQIYTDGSKVIFQAVGPHAIGGTTDPNSQVRIIGNFASPSSDTRALDIISNITSFAGFSAEGINVRPAFTVPSTGIVADLDGIHIELDDFVWTPGASNVTDVFGLRVRRIFAPSGMAGALTGIYVEPPEVNGPIGSTVLRSIWVTGASSLVDFDGNLNVDGKISIGGTSNYKLTVHADNLGILNTGAGDTLYQQQATATSTRNAYSIYASAYDSVYVNTQNSYPLVFGVSTGTGAGTSVAHMTILSTGTVGIGTTTGSNILTIQQTSATDPIADAWTVYSTKKTKNVINQVTDFSKIINEFKSVPVHLWTRKLTPPKETDFKDIKEKIKGEEKITRTAKEQYETTMAEYDKKKVSSKFTIPKYSLIAEEAPEFIKSYDDQGNLIGVDILAYVGFCHACLRGVISEIEQLKNKR